MDTIDKKTAETQNNLKDLQHVTNTFDDKVANFSKSLRMEFRETKDDMVKKIDEHVQLAIQDSRARNEDLEVETFCIFLLLLILASSFTCLCPYEFYLPYCI